MTDMMRTMLLNNVSGKFYLFSARISDLAIQYLLVVTAALLHFLMV